MSLRVSGFFSTEYRRDNEPQVCVPHLANSAVGNFAKEHREHAVDGHPNILRLNPVSAQSPNACAIPAVSVTAENGNMYTVMISDDGMFSAEYVQPPALSIPLGISGSSVEVRRNEDLTFSAMIDGEWVMITAETTVTAENGNVYAAVLSPEGIPIGVMHVAAMQEVMLGALGGTVTLTQAEDMTWWLGEMEVKDGTVYTAANGNMYALMMDAEGMWSAMYQKVMATVALGTQGSIELVRAEDMSWWLGSEGVGVGSEVMSDNGNTYTLWYTDGVWTARFEPESMPIEGTGLVAMTREADDMYDVGDSTLPASGMGDVMDGDAMYHVWMQEGTLAGARFATAIEAGEETRRAVGDLGDKGLHEEAVVFNLSADDADTPENELRTHLVVDGESFSVADLLDSGMASTTGKKFVAEALKEIQDIRADVDTLLALDLQDTALDPALDRQWGKVTDELNKIFGGTNGDAYTGGLSAGTGAAGTKNPGEDDILEEIDDIIDALSSADAFAAATAKDGKGVFDDAELSSDDAAAAYARTMSAATATLGVSGSTRYGTVRKTATDDAVTKLKYAPMDDNDTPGDDTDDTARIGQQGAFSYSTLQETLRTRHIVSTGNAYYTGGTHAISGDGTVYMGTMDVQVRFTSMTVSGLVSNLESAEGMPWEYRYGDVETIRLPEARLSSNARWAAAPNGMAQATFEARAGSPVPQNINGGATFNGILLGLGADSGSEASGTWSVGAESAKSDYLAGAFGVIRGEDVAPSLPGSDDGSGTETSVVSMIGSPATAIGGASIEDGMLKLKVKEYDYDITARTDDSLPALDLATLTWTIQTTPDPDGGTPTQNTVNLNIGLAGLLSSGTGTFNSAKHVDAQVEVITKQRDQLAALQGLGTRIEASEREAWQKVQEAIFRVLGSVPPKLNETYADVKDEAVDLIDDALAAFASNDALDAALDPNGSGIFKGVTNNVDSKVTAGGGGARTPAQIRGARQFQVRSKLGATSYTRFGVWRLSRLRNAVRSGRNGGADENRTRTHDSGADGPGMYAYSQLDPTVIASVQDPSYQSGSARYVGETVALQNTTYLTGEVDATVSWDAATVGGTLNVTFTNLANDNGDMLAFGTAATRDADGVITTAADYNVIRDVVFNNIDVGTNADNELIFDNEDIGTRTAGTFGIRYRFTDASQADNTSGAGLIEGKFVGATVDGPLALFGVWELNSNASLGRVNDVGNDIVDLDTAIYGAFGAEAP